MAKSKIDYLMTKSEKIPWGGESKALTIKAMKLRELLAFADEVKKVWEKYTTSEDGEKEDITQKNITLEFLTEVLQKEPVKLIDMIVEEEFTEDTLLDAYANDFMNLLKGFQSVNFTFLQNLQGSLGRFSQALTAVQNHQKKTS